MAKHIYVARQAKGLKFQVIVRDKEVMVRFLNGQFSTDDDELAEKMDEALRQPALARFCQKADRAAALQMAAQHQAMLKRTGAMKGGVTAHAMKAASETQKQERDAELNDINPTLKDQFEQDENLVLTDHGETAPSEGLGDPTANIPVGEQAPDPEPAAGDEGELATEAVKPKGLKLGAG